MSLAEDLAEKSLIPDFLIRLKIRKLLKDRLLDIYEGDGERQYQRYEEFKTYLQSGLISEHSESSKEQHYELPPEFFAAIFGKNIKYSSGYWRSPTTTLDESEDEMLALTCERAEIQEGQEILELGCGWGSLSLFMAKRFKKSKVTAVSNSQSQRAFIESKARLFDLKNIEVITTDIKDLTLNRTFDRIVSVEMFEHLRNYKELLRRCAGWLNDDGKIFIHVFCHREFGYEFRQGSQPSWMERNFFTGGVMPSDRIFFELGLDDLQMAKHWVVNGDHYGRTIRAALDNMDRKKSDLMPLFEKTYGNKTAARWFQKWRMFLMAYEETFKFRNGNEWWVSHNLLQKRSLKSSIDEDTNPVLVSNIASV